MRPRSRRSAGGNATPLLMRGSDSTARPRAVVVQAFAAGSHRVTTLDQQAGRAGQRSAGRWASCPPVGLLSLVHRRSGRAGPRHCCWPCATPRRPSEYSSPSEASSPPLHLASGVDPDQPGVPGQLPAGRRPARLRGSLPPAPADLGAGHSTSEALPPSRGRPPAGVGKSRGSRRSRVMSTSGWSSPQRRAPRAGQPLPGRPATPGCPRPGSGTGPLPPRDRLLPPTMSKPAPQSRRPS